MGDSLTYQEGRGSHSANSARGNLPGPARAIRTGHQAKLHERLTGWREIEVTGTSAVGHARGRATCENKPADDPSAPPELARIRAYRAPPPACLPAGRPPNAHHDQTGRLKLIQS
jgi:hypothetical protein